MSVSPVLVISAVFETIILKGILNCIRELKSHTLLYFQVHAYIFTRPPKISAYELACKGLDLKI